MKVAVAVGVIVFVSVGLTTVGVSVEVGVGDEGNEVVAVTVGSYVALGRVIVRKIVGLLWAMGVACTGVKMMPVGFISF